MAAYPRPHPEPQTRADAARLHPESTPVHHDYSYLLAALTHAVLDVADAIRETGATS